MEESVLHHLDNFMWHSLCILLGMPVCLFGILSCLGGYTSVQSNGDYVSLLRKILGAPSELLL